MFTISIDFSIAGFGSSKICSNAWLQWKSNKYWRKPCFWLYLCKTFGRTMKVMHSVWDTSRFFYPNLFVCVLQLWPGHSFEASQIYSRMIQNDEAKRSMPMIYAHLLNTCSESEGRACPTACVSWRLTSWLAFRLAHKRCSDSFWNGVTVNGFMPPWNQALTMFPHQAAIEAGNSHNILTLLTGGMSQP